MASSYIGTMSVTEWQEVCTHLFGLAIEGGETDFVMDMMPILMQYAAFCDVMCEMLMSVCSNHILYGDTRAIPEFIGSIICGNWPKDLNKAVNSINPVLFITMSIVKGWILVINEDNSLYYTPKSVKRNGANDTDNGQSAQQQEGRNSPVVVEASESRHGSEDIKDDESSISTQAEPSEEDIAALNRCCMALYVLCEKTQRSLWLKWPELCDEIYDAIRPAITHNKHVEP
ncbi:hypothetical protein WR25_15795 [Diploscapter pachys]|uniref:DUF7627 domain-containing protein n=1 Tax=Diploscapter pachys TaxID=2018661 RepID=A0A2A2LXG6_9BILA|nr:hypothetical protein WR25_15795 [Diploscapter pachys]